MIDILTVVMCSTNPLAGRLPWYRLHTVFRISDTHSIPRIINHHKNTDSLSAGISDLYTLSQLESETKAFGHVLENTDCTCFPRVPTSLLPAMT